MEYEVMVAGWDEQRCLRPLKWRGYFHPHFLLEAQTSDALNLPNGRSSPVWVNGRKEDYRSCPGCPVLNESEMGVEQKTPAQKQTFT